MVNCTAQTIKLLCSYNGKILPRTTDGTLRYVGGLTRVLAVDRSVSYAELMVKLGEFCGFSFELRCQLPDGDLETLISVKSDEELAFIVEEYERRRPGSKIRAVLSPPKSLKTVSPPQSIVFSPTKTKSDFHTGKYRSDSPPVGYPVGVFGFCGGIRYFPARQRGCCCRDPRSFENLQSAPRFGLR